MQENTMEKQQLFEKILSVVNQSETVIFYCQYQQDWLLLFISDNFADYGYAVDLLYSGQLKYHQLIHDEDLEGFKHGVKKAMASGQPHVSKTIRLLRSDSSIAWIDLRLTFERDENGEVTHLLGKFFDITEKVEAERQNRILAKVVEQTADLIKVTDVSGRLVFVNEALVEKTGYSEQELLGHKPSILKYDLANREKAQELWKTITSGQVYKNRIRNRVKGGNTYYEEITISPVYGDSGRIEYYVSTGKDLTEQEELQKSLNDMAMKDVLTGVSNRRYLSAVMCNEMDRANRYGQRFSLLMFDIDYFKSINDQYGHLVGDDVIIGVANRVNHVVRGTDCFGRWGGEEFMIIGLEMGLTATMALAEKIREAIGLHPFPVVGKVTVSVGATVYYRNETQDDLLKRVDEALYLAKNHGRNRVEII